MSGSPPRTGYIPHLQAQMADRVAFQADKAELPAKVLLRRELQCHQDPDLGHADSKPADDTTSTETETQVELRLATMVRIVLMYYINLDSFLEKPDEDMKRMLAEASESPPEDTKIQ